MVDVGIGEGLAERRHGAFLAVLDAVADEVVTARGVHQLRPLAGGAAPVGVAKAADGGEQLVDVEVMLSGRRRPFVGGGWRGGQRRQNGRRAESAVDFHFGTNSSLKRSADMGRTGAGCRPPPAVTLSQLLLQAVDNQDALVARHALVRLAEGRARNRRWPCHRSRR